MKLRASATFWALGNALTLPADVAVAEYLAGGVADVYVAVDAGPTPAGDCRMVMLSGYLSALQELKARLPDGAVTIVPGFTAALHSPLMARTKAFVAPFIADLPFADPIVPLCSCYEPEVLTDAAQVRDMFLRVPMGQASYPHLFTALTEHGADLAILAGPGMSDRFRRAPPCPVVQARSPDAVPDVLAAAHALGLPAA